MNTSKLALKLSWLVGLIIVLLPFHAILTTWAGSNTGHLDLWRIWKEILITAIAIPTLWLVWRSQPVRHWIKSSRIFWLINIYFVYFIAMGVWAFATHRANGSSVIYSWFINLRYLDFFLICVVLAAHNDWLKRMWRQLLLIPAGVVVAFGLAQKLFLPYDFLKHFGYSPKTIPAYQTVDASLDFRRIQSTLRGANPLGAYLSLILTATVALGYKAKSQFWWLAGLAAGLVALFFTYSRSAWIGLFISLVLLGSWATAKWRRPGSLLVIGGVVVLVLVAVVLVFNNSRSFQDTFLHTSKSSTSKESSNHERLQAMKNGAHDVIHQPLGGGPGTAGPASFRNSGHSPRVAENYYLQIGQEVGAFGIALFVAINILIGRELWRLRRDLLAQVLLASLVGITFINMLSHAWTDDTLSLIWWGLAGVAIGSYLRKPAKNT